jgi:catechol 2,3-dioxygenase-like lactoylglutathione lyase family enzyme
MHARNFVLQFSPSDYERSVQFYKDWLGLELIRDWNRATDKGTLLSAAGGAVVELVNPPDGQRYDGPPPANARLLFEVNSADAEFDRLSQYPITVVEPPTDRTWGHRSFRLRDPDGVLVTLYQLVPSNT